jgi:hypothetical protein
MSTDSDYQLKERFQNPNCGDNIRLRLFSFNSNYKKNVHSIKKIDIIRVDEENKEYIIKTIDPIEIQNPRPGEYYIDLNLNIEEFIIGNYLDRWEIQFEESQDCATNKVNNFFQILPSIWFTSSGPNIYDFSFKFKPNKMVLGSKKYIVIEINPITPRVEDIEKYYSNIAITSNLKINIEKNCTNCPEDEEEIIIEDELIEFREKNLGYYLLDTQDMEEGIYNIWFKLEHGENVYVSEKNQFQIFN